MNILFNSTSTEVDSTYLAIRHTWLRQKWIRLTWSFDLIGNSTYLVSAELDSTDLAIRLKGFDITEIRHNWIRHNWLTTM